MLQKPEPWSSPLVSWFDNNLSFQALDTQPTCLGCSEPAVDGSWCEVHSKDVHNARIDWEALKEEAAEDELIDPDLLRDELLEYGPDYKAAQHAMEDKADNDAKDLRG